jgi:hypothetical protein
VVDCQSTESSGLEDFNEQVWQVFSERGHVLVRPGGELLTGKVEMDETFIGGIEAGLKGGRARGKKSLVGVAVELKAPKGYGRCRMALLADASAARLGAFLAEHVAVGATMVTDGWQGYNGITDLGYVHHRRSQRATRARGRIPASCCRECTASHYCPSDGYRAPTRVR